MSKLPSLKRIFRQLRTDLYIWTRSRWLIPGILLLFLLVGVWSWFEAGALLEEVSDKKHAGILAKSKIWGVLSNLWQGIFEAFSFLAVILGSLALATEYGSGRIRILMSQPLQRNEFFLSRALRSLVIPQVLAGACLLFSLFVLNVRVGFGDLVDPDFVTVAAYKYSKLSEAYFRIFTISMLALLASSSFGVFVSVLSRSGIQSVMLGMFGYFVLRAVGTYPADWVKEYLFTGVLHRAMNQSAQLASGITGMYKEIMRITYEDPAIFVTVIVFLGMIGLSGWLFRNSDLR